MVGIAFLSGFMLFMVFFLNSESALILKTNEEVLNDNKLSVRNYFGEGSESTYLCILIDMTKCNGDQCLLGYETDVNGCVISCECKKEGLLEGDILVKENDLPAFNYLYGLNHEPRGAAIPSGSIKRWKQRDGAGNIIIPYAISPSIMGKPKFKLVIQRAIDQFKQRTCIRLVPKTSQSDFLNFVFGSGCFTSLGRQGGSQDVNLGVRCLNVGSFVHEIMHTLGFYHEQSRPDRDNHVVVLFQNLLSKMASQMKKMTNKDINSLGSPYDLNSVMQYGGFSFTSNGRATLLNKITKKPVLAQRDGLSVEDVTQIATMYKC